MKRYSWIIVIWCLCIFCLDVQAHPIEVGNVKWGRDLDAALVKSAATKRPVFVLFQEVPGCIGCQQFGKEVLRHPLIVEAIEDEFLPVLVYNNRSGGIDRKLMEQFNEPAWNYQVVRFLNAAGQDILPRKDRVWTLDALASRMIKALQASNRTVPKYLKTVALENAEANFPISDFAVPCFWTGEVELGKIDGVIHTQAGWIAGDEVTRVVYDKKQVSLPHLIEKAKQANCAKKVYADTKQLKIDTPVTVKPFDTTYRKANASDQSKQLARWKAILELPGITKMQKTKINAWAPSNRKKALEWLSPRQMQLLKDIETRTE